MGGHTKIIGRRRWDAAKGGEKKLELETCFAGISTVAYVCAAESLSEKREGGRV